MTERIESVSEGYNNARLLLEYKPEIYQQAKTNYQMVMEAHLGLSDAGYGFMLAVADIYQELSLASHEELDQFKDQLNIEHLRYKQMVIEAGVNTLNNPEHNKSNGHESSRGLEL